ncbi:MAG: hypothetical protein ACSLE1_03125 [Sphingobium sp.]
MSELTIGERGQIMRGAATVAQMITTNHNHKQMVSDRALFLAAPLMLEALELVLDTYGFDSSTDSSIWQTVTAAISRAHGDGQ